MLSYTICAPPFSHMNGGIRALYKLGYDILTRGYPITYYHQSKDTDGIVIYPEIVQGNPFKAERYVKWLLNKADHPNDICYAWESGMGDYPLLTVNIIEMSLWTPSAQRTKNVAYWVGKGVIDESLIPDGAIEITRNNFTDREQLAKFISQLDYLISFDAFSSINFESIVAGTPVLIHVSESQWSPYLQRHEKNVWSKEEIEKHGWVKYGIAWSIDELDDARKNVHLARQHYEELISVFDSRVDNFIEETQKLFG